MAAHRSMVDGAAMTPARDPQPGRAYRTGAEGGSSGALKFQLLGFSTTSQNTEFPKLVRGCGPQRGSLSINSGDGRRGGCAPRTPLHAGGAPHPGPPKRRSAPLAAAVVRFLS